MNFIVEGAVLGEILQYIAKWGFGKNTGEDAIASGVYHVEINSNYQVSDNLSP